MRTKALLALALSVGGMSLAVCQTVSQNIVGYVNVDIKPGLTMIANQLDNKNGNKVSDLIPKPANGTTLYTWVPGTGFSLNSFFDVWDFPNNVLAPGQGAFVDNPDVATKFTFVGEVMLGTQTVNLPVGLSIFSSVVPTPLLASEMTLTGPDTFPIANGDTIYKYTNGTGYTLNSYFDGYDFPAMTIAVGESVFFENGGAAKVWSRTFTVQ